MSNSNNKWNSITPMKISNMVENSLIQTYVCVCWFVINKLLIHINIPRTDVRTFGYLYNFNILVCLYRHNQDGGTCTSSMKYFWNQWMGWIPRVGLSSILLVTTSRPATVRYNVFDSHPWVTSKLRN